MEQALQSTRALASTMEQTLQLMQQWVPAEWSSHPGMATLGPEGRVVGSSYSVPAELEHISMSSDDPSECRAVCERYAICTGFVMHTRGTHAHARARA